MDRLIPNLTKFVPQLRKILMLPGCGHWTQQERLPQEPLESQGFERLRNRPCARPLRLRRPAPLCVASDSATRCRTARMVRPTTSRFSSSYRTTTPCPISTPMAFLGFPMLT
jgi:hypothetical protein